jgi:hypothetical protein
MGMIMKNALLLALSLILSTNISAQELSFACYGSNVILENTPGSSKVEFVLSIRASRDEDYTVLNFTNVSKQIGDAGLVFITGVKGSTSFDLITLAPVEEIERPGVVRKVSIGTIHYVSDALRGSEAVTCLEE